MHQIRQKKPKPSKRNATSSLIAPTSSARPTSALVNRAARSTRSRRQAVRVRRARLSIVRRDRRSRVGVVARSGLSPLSLSDLDSLFSLSLSLSLSLKKLFEVKMRGETDFRVKGENIGQPEVIFRKMIFSVTAKHAEKGENDFLKSFSPKTNAP